MASLVDIITCPQWGARKPKLAITHCARADEIIIHHTAGHHPEISNPQDESFAEGVRYAHAIQDFHMAPGGLGAPQGGIDSGHNFLILRNGMVFQGRWHTVSAIEDGGMVVSAHCPGKNTQIGIEHEHKVGEKPTKPQLLSSALLIAWISVQYGLTKPLPLFPHRRFFPTDCPDVLANNIPSLALTAHQILSL